MVASSTLVLHRGAKLVTEDELKDFKAPPPEGRWYPISHSRVLETVRGTLTEAGYEIRNTRLGVTPDGNRFFGTLDLGTAIVSGISLAVGIRNSCDKSFPIGFCAGSRCFVCDNLSFKAELLVRKRHTINGEKRFVTAIASAVTSLNSFRASEAERIKRLLHQEMTADQADALILRSFEKGIIGARELPRVLHEWRNPSHEEFQPRTAWSLLNAYTSALRERAVQHPHQYAVQTMRLNGLLDLKSEGTPPLPVHDGGLPEGVSQSA